jgi:hypothetical protein
MPDQTVLYPVSFYIAGAILGVGMLYGWTLRQKGIGLPMMVVLSTVGAWYFLDVLYNDYAQYQLQLGVDILDGAWWQVILFILSFCIFAPFMHRSINKDMLHERSHILRLSLVGGLENAYFQSKITAAFRILTAAWLIIMVLALFKTNFDFLGLIAPFVQGKAQPWGRGRIGGGFDAFLSFASYLHIMLVAGFGVIVALSKDVRTRAAAGVIYLLSAPWFFLDRTRNTMLAIALPGLLAWVFLRVKGGLFFRIGILLVFFVLVDGWMRFVIQTRSGADIAMAFQEVGLGGVTERVSAHKAKHEGLNMFEELAWTNYLILNKQYEPNWGARYFAELVNPIPRVLWPGKPMIGIDYSIARGQKWEGAAARDGGVGATISTGMIGQGVVNFGPFFGVVAAALLMATWAAILARQDLKGEKTGRLLLYMVGMVLTFNLGRDITLITLYPFLFGFIMLVVFSRARGER